MQNRRLIALMTVGLVTLIVSAFLYLLLQQKPASNINKTGETTIQNNTAAPPTTDRPSNPTTAQTKGSYVDYSATAFQAAANQRRILFFHAAWCPQCRTLESSIQAGQIPAGLAIFKVNYDTSQQLRQQYGVTLQTTLIEVDAAGGLLKKFVAYDEPSLAALVREFGAN